MFLSITFQIYSNTCGVHQQNSNGGIDLLVICRQSS